MKTAPPLPKTPIARKLHEILFRLNQLRAEVRITLRELG